MMHQDLHRPEKRPRIMQAEGKENTPVQTLESTTGWYNRMKCKTVSTPSKIHLPKAHLISTVSNTFRASNKLIPYKDASGTIFPINHIRELVPAANRYLKQCERGRAFKTYYAHDTRKDVPPPPGMHLFGKPAEITDELYHNALQDINLLYKHPEHKRDPRIHMLKPHTPPTNEILFYSRDVVQPSFTEVMRLLHKITPRLAEYVMVYYKAVQSILGATDAEMERLSISLVHYDSTAGLNPHIDTVHIFGDTLGPIFTVAMGDSEKMLDLLPILLPDDRKPVRLFSQPNEIMVMDGESRILWAHAKPWGYTPEQFTLVFKFWELATKIRTESFQFEDTHIEIPYYVA
jgi:hypothetical protein